ncbi:MAG: bifunctional [glutamate--ammonia ligase]-adenylyl-L-tyrosine phosphorylase/[glutamate--ammonia-ligase] adenylyltransferase [Gammaproteobacteria bacterium]|nr:MAG: bifunctional [glutamate--ammonia ligase]-adenylyl-L-tyrosine phosphorylase/[glutamate--ammonia-ligase] adenylyltransferase [Gammaproteobacteria bacterium]
MEHDLAVLPEPLRAETAQALDTLLASPEIRGVLDRDPSLRPTLARVAACSPFVVGVLRRYPQLLVDLAQQGRLARCSAEHELAGLVAAGVATQPGEDAFQRGLRLARHRELLRIVWREVAGVATVRESLRDLSDLADAAIRAALDWSLEQLRQRHGVARTEAGEPCGFAVLGMGKLGGFELNFSSDVDLVFVYTEAGESDGAKRLSNEEYFRLLGQRLIALLSQQTVDGFVYRVDVRLRPFGASGPLALSLPALEHYLMRNGRDWERYAYIKARAINDWADAGYFYDAVVRPFVYRRYLDYGVFASLRDMKALIEAEVQRKEYQADIKLGPGGIREIEFIVQSFQLVRGGSVAGLRGREILEVLPALARHGCLSPSAVTGLTGAYLFLRRVENAIQAIGDTQTHLLPADGINRDRLVLALGYADWHTLAADIERHRETVARHFRDVVFRGEEGEATGGRSRLHQVWREQVTPEAAAGLLRESGFAHPEEILERLRQLRSASALQRLDEPGRQRLNALVPAVLEIAGRQSNPRLAVEGVARVIEAVGRRSAYFALLNENPAARERLVSLCAMSDFLANQVAAHPLLLDELLDQRMFSEPPSRAELIADLARRLDAVAAEDNERWLEALKNFQQAAKFRIAVADLSGVLPLMKVSDRLTETAELVLQASLDQATRELVARHGQPRCVVDGKMRAAEFGIAAYGKLGGLELGYASDLDLVFLHDSAGEAQQTDGEKPLENAVFFARLARRIINIATMLTAGGHLYEVDTRLQPEGKKGLLVTSLAALESYQKDGAWTWEHQALLRGRGIAGSAQVLEGFEDLRRRVLTQYVRRDSLRVDVLDMRERMVKELAKGTAELFDIKQDPGGVTDIEFMVQYLVLREACAEPALVRWSDNIRQLEALVAAAVIPAATGELLTDIYRNYRQRLHHLSLAGEPGFMPRAEAVDAIGAVRRTWDQVFG